MLKSNTPTKKKWHLYVRALPPVVPTPSFMLSSGTMAPSGPVVVAFPKIFKKSAKRRRHDTSRKKENSAQEGNEEKKEW